MFKSSLYSSKICLRYAEEYSILQDEEGHSEMLKLVCAMLSRPECEAFRSPVDWKTLELFDYPDVVKSPMDLGTVKKGIESGKYSTIEEIANDIRLVWSNCMLYNRDGSEFYHLADSFSIAFEESYLILRRMEDSKLDKDRVPNLQERMQMSHDIFKLDSVEMAAILTMIEKSCPSALSRRPSHDEVFINIDAIKPSCFHEMNSFILNCFLSRTASLGGKKKRKTDASSTAAPTIGSSKDKPPKKLKV